MSYIIEQRVDGSGLFMKATNGRTFFMSAADLKAIYTTNTGKGQNAESAKTNAVTSLKDQVTTALGSEIFDKSAVFLDFDASTGRVTESAIGDGQPVKSAATVAAEL